MNCWNNSLCVFLFCLIKADLQSRIYSKIKIFGYMKEGIFLIT